MIWNRSGAILLTGKIVSAGVGECAHSNSLRQRSGAEGEGARMPHNCTYLQRKAATGNADSDPKDWDGL